MRAILRQAQEDAKALWLEEQGDAVVLQSEDCFLVRIEPDPKNSEKIRLCIYTYADDWELDKNELPMNVVTEDGRELCLALKTKPKKK